MMPSPLKSATNGQMRYERGNVALSASESQANESPSDDVVAVYTSIVTKAEAFHPQVTDCIPII